MPGGPPQPLVPLRSVSFPSESVSFQSALPARISPFRHASVPSGTRQSLPAMHQFSIWRGSAPSGTLLAPICEQSPIRASCAVIWSPL